MKTALMTWYHYANYGTALQAAAMVQILRDLGHDPYLIRYRPYSQHRSLPDYSLSALAERSIRLLDRKQSGNPGKAYAPAEKTALFERFCDEHMQFTDACRTKADLENLNASFDAFICGSDQIWSPLIFNPRYYLDFVHDDGKKIAYAPSIGTDRIKDPYVRERMRELIASFAALSVREKDGAEIIQELCGKEAQTVLDPTLLLTGEEWRQKFHIGKSRQKKPYLLVYMLGENEEYQKVIAETARLLQLQVLRIPMHEKDLDYSDCLDDPAGPDAFLSYMAEASYVCTDSLHGMIFCHLFHRPFTAFARFGKHDPRNQNSRVMNLLAMTGMEDRLYRNGLGKQIAVQKTDFSAADEKLALMRGASLSFLRQALAQAEKTSSGKRHVMYDNSLCCGCGNCQEVCPSHAVRIVMNKDGFLQAEVDETRCIRCGRCTNVCPFCGETKNTPAQSASLYAFQSSSQDVLKRSSSGGAAYHIARMLLKEGYAIGGCRFNPEKQRAEHVLVQDEEGLRQLQGSKYIQSDFTALQAQLKELSLPAAIFGTPCQIAALKRMFGDRQDIICIDLVCHGVPSAFLFDKYREYLHQTAGLETDRMNMSFRYKEKGWSSIHLHADDGSREYCCSGKEDPFFRMFDAGCCYNRACYECRWRKDSESDIRLADYWGPRFKDDKNGVSMVIGFSEKGRAMIRRLAETGWGKTEEEPIEDYLQYQQSENLPEPVFYDALIGQLRSGAHDLPALAEKYALPLENRPLSSFEHVVYAMKMMLFKE